MKISCFLQRRIMEKSISTCYLVQRMKYWMDATSYGTLRKFCNRVWKKSGCFVRPLRFLNFSYNLLFIFSILLTIILLLFDKWNGLLAILIFFNIFVLLFNWYYKASLPIIILCWYIYEISLENQFKLQLFIIQ